MSAYASSAAGGFADQTGRKPASDRRTRHRERRRNEVYAAAVQLFIQQGFAATTMEQIASRADVSRATVFNHFPRKTALIDEWAARRHDKAAAALRDENTVGWPLDKVLGRYMLEIARQSIAARQETVALMSAAGLGSALTSHTDLADEFANLIIGAQQSGQVPSSVNPQQAALLAAAFLSAVLVRWTSEEPAPFDLEAELLTMLDILLNGIAGLRLGKPESGKITRHSSAGPRRGRGHVTPKVPITAP
jgi:AcrR family transcriptional regulator